MLTCITSVGYIIASTGILSLPKVPNYCQLK